MVIVFNGELIPYYPSLLLDILSEICKPLCILLQHVKFHFKVICPGFELDMIAYKNIISVNIRHYVELTRAMRQLHFTKSTIFHSMLVQWVVAHPQLLLMSKVRQI